MNMKLTKIAGWSTFFCLSIVLAGCTAIKSGHTQSSSTDKVASQAFNAPESTTLGQMAMQITSGHGDDSGFLLLDRGRDALSWRLILADAAEKSIDIQYFLWKNDAVGKVFIQRLLGAAERGVRIRVLIDDSMTDSDPEYLALLGAPANIEVRIYKPFGPKAKSVLRWIDYVAHMKVNNRRMHNKLYVVDGCMEIIGGRNIAEEYFEYPGSFAFRSRDLLAIGPVVETSGAAFDMYWNSDWSVPIEQVVTHVPTMGEAAENKAALDVFAADATSYPTGFYDNPKQLVAEMNQLTKALHWGKGQLLIDDVPEKDGESQSHAEIGLTGPAIGQAALHSTNEALIQSAYLILEDAGEEKLRTLVDRGVKVKLHTNSMAANNHLSAYVAYRKQRKMLLNSGAEVYEMRPDAKSERSQYTPAELKEHGTKFGLHAKTMVFDRKVVFVGTFNLDPRSIHLNTEMGLLVESEGLGRAVAESIENDIAPGNSWRVVLNNDGRTQWVTLQDGVASEQFEFDPMTTAARRAKAEAMAFIPDSGQM